MPLVMIAVFFASLIVSSVISWLIVAMKKPTREKASHLGGVALGISFFSAVVLGLPVVVATGSFAQIKPILFGAMTMFLVGFLDDRKELSVLAKFIFESIIAIFVILGGIKTQMIGLGDLGNSIVAFLWIVGITNAFNHLDVADGLAGGIALICGISFLIFSALTHNIATFFLLLAISASISGFMPFNFVRGVLYMGNAGSHFLGFLLATISILLSYATFEKRICLFIPILILGFPLYDTSMVIFIRFRKKIPFWKKSNDHLIFLLRSAGYSRRNSLFLLYGFAALFTSIALAIFLLPFHIGFLALCSLIIFCSVVSLRIISLQRA